MPGGAGPEERWLLRGISVAVGSGERIAIVGPTGAGKTVLLRAMALLDPLDEGEILWRGRPIDDAAVPGFRRRAIYLHQRPALVEGTVEGNLRRPFGFTASNGGYDPVRMKETLSALGRDASFLAKLTADLSGGEAQIAAFLRAIQLDPRVLLLDEPTAALDREAASAIERLVEGWFAEEEGERALIWVSHDHDQARRMTGRVIGLSAGRMGHEGSAVEPGGPVTGERA
jgi:putative ABC transport system ATP-binding protein